MRGLNNEERIQNLFLQTTIVDDFTSLDADVWTDTSGDSGAACAGTDAAGGVVTLTTGGTDNNEAYLLSKQECFKFLAARPIKVGSTLKWTEANTDDANVAFGLMDAVGADSIVDDGAGPKASYSGALFYKTDGGTKWNFETSIAGAQVTTAIAYPAISSVGDGVYRRLEIFIDPVSSTEALAKPFINGEQCRDANGVLISHSITMTSATEMNLFVGVKAGGANSEVVSVDKIYGTQAA